MNDVDYVDCERHLIIQFIKDVSNLDKALDNTEFDSNCFKDKLARESFKWLKKRYIQNKSISIVKFSTKTNFNAKKLLDYNIPFEVESKEIKDIIDYLIELKTRRKVYTLSNKFKQLSQEKELSKKEIENKAQELVFNTTNNFQNTKGIYSIEEALKEFHGEFWEIQDGKKKIAGFPTGIVSLDRALNGLPRTHESIIAASTSRGKTSLAILIALNSIKNQLKTAFISLEMITIEIVRKMIALDSKVPTSLYTRKFTDYEGNVKDQLKNIFNSVKNNMNASFDRLHELDFYISDTRGLDTTDIKARCRNIKREMEGLDLVIVDYLQMINFNKMYGDNKEQKTGQAVLDLRNMASELDCHVMTLSQFHRINKDGPPSMHYMRDSGRIEEIADEIILPYRPQFDEEDGSPEEASLIIDKGRTKGRSEVDMIFYPNIQYWRSKAVEENEGPLDIIEG
jgi:replicative DNA helicase